ncbi:hypothetical protein [Bacillus licheniformis]|uniref:hypothetical protein n=1 Tax=Bacillus licheniformis TaxID=1402 RepID=UPI002E1D1EA4|nr:hypothetical protein [Bacillus licheniformis]
MSWSPFFVLKGVIDDLKKNKSTGSMVQVWKSQDRDCFRVKIEALGVILSVCKDSQPKSYSKIEHWLNNEEPFHPITFEKE